MVPATPDAAEAMGISGIRHEAFGLIPSMKYGTWGVGASFA